MQPFTWSEYMPLLALFAASAAYVSAVRIWFHKLRMDALDALKKAYGADEPFKPDHLKSRLRATVRWLRGLAVIDLAVVVGAGCLFRRAFHDWLPSRCWFQGRSFDEFGLVVQLMWLVFVLLCFAHLTAAVRAFVLDPEFDASRTGERTPTAIERFEACCYRTLMGGLAAVVFFCA